MEFDPLLTEDKFLELKKKLERLKKIVHPQAAAEVRRLAETGDFSENAGYQNAKGRLRGINQKILILEDQINHSQIIKSQKQTDKVQLGHTVSLSINNDTKTYKILGSTESDPKKGIISVHSPIGSALIGKKIGDVVTINLANSKTEYLITKIE